eukprot:87228_1
MTYTTDTLTKAKMTLEIDDAIEKCMFRRFEFHHEHSNSMHPILEKTTHQCMAQCYDKHKKAKPIWECLSNCQRMIRRRADFLAPGPCSWVTDYDTGQLKDPASECLKDSSGSTQALANEEYTKCIRKLIRYFLKISDLRRIFA